ncbi:MAG: hypothetical protein M5U14_09005 [Acidimicrobiia bacterium]|nr:hypothetical protein [Acidimicrobiia bacterium]
MRLRLDDHTADRVLAGTVLPGDAPPGWEHAAEVLAAVARLPVELPAGEDLLARVVATVGRPATSRRCKVLSALGTKAATLGAAGVLSLGGVAAAATGSLPDPVQDVVSDAAGHVGLELPSPGEATSGEPTSGEGADTEELSRVVEPQGDEDPTGGEGGTTDSQEGTSEDGAEELGEGLVECDEAVNHGEYVSSVARSEDPEDGTTHGERVSEAARSHCGKPGPGEDEEDEGDAGDELGEGAGVTEPEVTGSTGAAGDEHPGRGRGREQQGRPAGDGGPGPSHAKGAGPPR